MRGNWGNTKYQVEFEKSCGRDLAHRREIQRERERERDREIRREIQRERVPQTENEESYPVSMYISGIYIASTSVLRRETRGGEGEGCNSGRRPLRFVIIIGIQDEEGSHHHHHHHYYYYYYC